MTAEWGIGRSAAMWWRQAAWNLRAASRQKPSRPLSFDKAARNRVLLASLGDPISQSQIYPFHFYAREAKRAYGTQILELGLDAHLQRPELAPRGADVVCFQAWIGKSAEELRAIVGCLRQRNPGSKLVFLDPFAPADLRYAAPLGPLIDLYVKKHVLRDRLRYGAPTSGDTNLTDWYGKRFGLDQSTVRFDIPEGFFSKLVLGPSFMTSPNMLPDFAQGRFADPAGPRHINLHTRIGGGIGNSWYGRMRTESLA